MNGKIDDKGWLHIERNGNLVLQLCPYHSNEKAVCSHFCPHFGEPNEFEDDITGKAFLLSLCNGTVLSFEQLTDER